MRISSPSRAAADQAPVGQGQGQRTKRAARMLTVAGLLCEACGSDHHVSPWPQGVRIDAIAQPPDLGAHLGRVALEMQAERLAKTCEINGKLPSGDPFVIQGFEGDTLIGRRRSAVRVITARGVVLALGPREFPETGRGGRTLLVQSLADGGGWKSGSDLNGDGLPDVALAGVDGTFELWGILSDGASPYPMLMVSAPNQALDIDQDGRPDPAVRLTPIEPDPIAPSIVEVATFSNGAYRNDTPEVRSWHQRQRQQLEPQADAGLTERPTLGQALEHAWHSIRAGEDKDSAIAVADAAAAAHAPLGPGVAQAWVRWRGWLQDNVR